MKVFLTGATGFLGRHVGVALAAAGHQLLALRRTTSVLPPDAVLQNSTTWFPTDAGDWPQQIISARPDAIIHCAWAGVTAAERDDWRIQAQNLTLFSELLHIATAVELPRFIAFGSQAEYGPIHGRVAETHPLRPASAYGAAKVACLTLLETCARQQQLSYAWLRLFSIYGPGEGAQWFIPSLIRQLQAGQAPALTGCEQRYDYLHVRDLAAGVLRVLAAPSSSGVFHLGSNTSVSLRSVAELIQRFTPGSAAPVFGALPYRPNQSMHLEGDSSHFYRAFGFAPQISLEDGLREYVTLAQI